MRGDDVGNPSGRRDPPLVQDRQPVRQLLGLLQIVRGQHDRGAAVAQLTDQRPGLVPGLGVQPGRGLVQEQHLRVAQQRQGQVQPPPLTAGQLLDPYVLAPLQPHPAKRLGDRPRPGGAPGPHPRRLLGRQVGREPALLEHHADPRPDPGPLAERIVPQHPDLPGRRRGQPLQQFQGGGLAGPVGPQQCEQLSPRDREVDPPYGLEPRPSARPRPAAPLAPCLLVPSRRVPVRPGPPAAVRPAQSRDVDHVGVGPRAAVPRAPGAFLPDVHAPSVSPVRDSGQCALSSRPMTNVSCR